MAALIKLRKFLRYGSVKCIYCGENIESEQYNIHIIQEHEMYKNFCNFCGVFLIQRNKSGKRILPSSYEHMYECAVKSRKSYKEMDKPVVEKAVPTPIENSIGVVTRYALKRKRRGNDETDIAIDSNITISDDKLKKALDMRMDMLSGKFISEVFSSNIEAEKCVEVLDFFKSDIFEIPSWLLSLSQRFTDRTIRNGLEFHQNSNIDTFWAKVYGMKELEFHHVFVHICIFDKFREMITRERNHCTLMRYGCMCDKHDRNHVHFVMVSLKDSKIARFFNNNIFSCHITQERKRLSKLMKEENISIVPSWPDHRHFHMKVIQSDMHLFNTIKYISTRQSELSHKKAQMENVGYELLNVVTEKQHVIQKEVDELIKRYSTNLEYAGSHFNIFRPLSEDAPMWFAAVSRNGLYSYVRYIMDKCSLIEYLDKVEVSAGRNCSIEFRHIMNNLEQYAIPLKWEDYIFHNACSNKQISIGRRDLDRYINLGKNQYMYLAKGTRACCEEYAKDIFFANQPTFSYDMTYKQCHEHKVYKIWTDKKEEEFKQQLKMKDSELNSVKERLSMEESEFKHQLQLKDIEISSLKDRLSAESLSVKYQLQIKDFKIKHLQEISSRFSDIVEPNLRNQVLDVIRENAEMKGSLDFLKQRNTEMDGVISELRKRNAELEAIISELRRQNRNTSPIRDIDRKVKDLEQRVEMKEHKYDQLWQENMRLKKQLQHYSVIIGKKSGPYLESNDKSDV